MIEILVAVLIVYLVLLLLLELFAWKFQPDMENSITLVFDLSGTEVERKLYGFEHNGKLYVSSNHWFRQWYNAVLKNPNVLVERGGIRKPHIAVSIEGLELVEIVGEYRLGFLIRLMSGFAPRRFLRLDPV